MALILSHLLAQAHLQFAFPLLYYGFGGLSILMQVASIISDKSLSMKAYWVGKILHAIFSTIYTALLIHLLYGLSH